MKNKVKLVLSLVAVALSFQAQPESCGFNLEAAEEVASCPNEYLPVVPTGNKSGKIDCRAGGIPQVLPELSGRYRCSSTTSTTINTNGDCCHYRYLVPRLPSGNAPFYANYGSG